MVPGRAAPAARGDPRPRNAWSYCCALAVALGSAGHLQDSREAFHEALALLPADSPAKGAAITGAAMIDHLLGQHDQAQSLLLESLAEVEDRSEQAAALKVALAGGSFFSADWTGMRYWAEEALKVPEHTATLSARGSALLALAHYGLCEIEEAGGRGLQGGRDRR